MAFDGTGYGLDGTSWGGELLIADYEGYERIATFRSMPLAGGNLAIREVWRLALAVLDDAFAGEPPLGRLPFFQDLEADNRAVSVVRRMIATGLNAPRARGVGRWFDAIGSLDKRLHAHPGVHSAVPVEEIDASEWFLARHPT